MGSYLSEPVTEKESNDEANDKLKCGASSMQGWRVSQEDAHNCLLDFDENTSLFAVYDGHGGHEVAAYCAQELPQYIKNTEAYKNGQMDKALIDAFLGFDSTIATREVVAKLKEIAGDKEAQEESDEEESVSNLYEEATMPIEQVIEKYTGNLLNPTVKSLQKDVEKHPQSPFLRARKDNSSIGCASSSNNPALKLKVANTSETVTDNVSSSSNVNDLTKNVTGSPNKSDTTNSVNSTTNGNNSTREQPEIKVDSPDSSNDINECTTTKKSKSEVEASSTNVDVKAGGDQPNQNGEVEMAVVTDSTEKSDVSSSTPQENGEISKKGKGKALAKTKGVVQMPTPQTRPKRNAQQLYNKLLDFESDSESEDEEDQTFEGPIEESSDEEEGLNSTVEGENSEDSSDDEEEEDDEEDDEDDLGDDNEEDLEFARNMREEPGSDSGCTAVVALLRGNELYVANAGDSRCIVCRNGKAIEMSFDHKPEDEPERERVVKAGGKVTADGRVNGGLNLSRAIGDHAYKQKKELSDREQMITALPDVRTLTINPGEDEFLVLACDGIWNFMSSQEVVEFVKPRIEEGQEKLSHICEEMFDHCLAPNTMGDGTGCDNMTAIIIQFKSNICKRAASPIAQETESSKRAKTEDNVSRAESTTPA